MKTKLRRSMHPWLAAVSASIALSLAANAQLVPNSDHLKCYRIKEELQPTRYVADLANQFGLEAGCVIGTPARLFCAETAKRIVSPNLPPGGGPSGKPAGHFLCYPVKCAESATVPP